MPELTATKRWDFWNGPDEVDRRIKYANQVTPDIIAAGNETAHRVSVVQQVFTNETGVILPEGFSSGWRPKSVNEITANAGKLSNHLTGHAGDKRDTIDGEFTWWCMRNVYVLEQHHLWMEHPIATVVRAWVTAKEQKRAPTPWCHLQQLPPTSGKRVYMPDKKSIPEWDAFLNDQDGYAGMTHAAWLASIAGSR